MRHYIIKLTVFLLVTIPGYSVLAQPYTPVISAAAFKTLFAAKSASILTLKCDFIQEKSISMLQHKINSSGSFIYKKNNKLRMEYIKPYPFLFILDNDKVIIENDRRTSSVSASSNKMYQVISKMTLDCFTGNVLNSNEFSVIVSENTQVYYLQLVPRQKMLRSLFDKIQILISKSDFTVDRIELNETSGDTTILMFSNKRINAQVNDDVFKVN
ncbi:MAG: outer membrane lipoprotein carrier protein LolA [Bacteroidales bacterium]